MVHCRNTCSVSLQQKANGWLNLAPCSSASKRQLDLDLYEDCASSLICQIIVVVLIQVRDAHAKSQLTAMEEEMEAAAEAMRQRETEEKNRKASVTPRLVVTNVTRLIKQS